jgi:hypothetical protein
MGRLEAQEVSGLTAFTSALSASCLGIVYDNDPFESSPPNEEGMNEDGRRYVGPSHPLFDRPRKQIRRASVEFESATAAD